MLPLSPHHPAPLARPAPGLPRNLLLGPLIALLLALPQTCIDRLGGVRTSLEKRVGYRLTFEDTLSLLLFDYVVEQKAARVLDTLGLGRSESRDPGSENAPFSH